MPATIVVGGQYGSEGKGKVTAILANRAKSPWLVRCGGPNSGHTVTINGRETILRQVPSSTNPRHGVFCIAAGCVVDESLLIDELDTLGIEKDRIIVDPRAVILSYADGETEQNHLGSIASTFSGTGAALVRRMARTSDPILVRDSAPIWERCRVEALAPLLHGALDNVEDVIVEGTQGFSLSLLHGRDYPFVTSRDTSASGFASEAGLSPRSIDKIVMVVRTFPIRVGGPSGPFANEITWEEVQKISGAPTSVPEFTSVTRRLRRVARFDLNLVVEACRYNRPTSLAVMGLDRLDYANSAARSSKHLTSVAQKFLSELESATGVPVELAGTGFRTLDVLELGVEAKSRDLCLTLN